MEVWVWPYTFTHICLNLGVIYGQNIINANCFLPIEGKDYESRIVWVEKMSARRRTHFVTIGMPTNCFKVSPDETKFDMFKIHKSNWTVPCTEKIDLHNQSLVVQLQKYPNTFLLVLFVSSQIVQNVVALTHFVQHLPHVEKTTF